MENKVIGVIVFIILLFGLTGCGYKELNESDKEYIETIKSLKKEKEAIELELNSRMAELSTITQQIGEKQLILKGTAKYVMKINIAQSHFTLDLSQLAKDMLNDVDIYVEVSEDFYNKYNVGDTINDDLRVGSLIFKGSIGSWNIKVADKQIVEGE